MIKQKRRQRQTAQMKRWLHIHGFLEELLKRQGSVNQYMRFVYGHGNACTAPPPGIKSSERHRYCQLRTQCHATRMTINYFFCEPVIVLSEIPLRVSDLLHLTDPSHNVVNLEIAIPSHFGFLGHVFNVILLKTQAQQPDIFCVQSYLMQYTVNFEEYTIAKLENLLRIYYTMFFSGYSPVFTEADARLWPIVTDVRLTGFYGESLVGTSKPMHGSTMRICSFHTDNLSDYLRNRYEALLLDTLMRLFLMTDEESYMNYLSAFGDQDVSTVQQKVQKQMATLSMRS